MTTLYKSKYYQDLTFFLDKGWTEEEVNTYFPLLESFSNTQLLKLLEACNSKMFSSDNEVDKEQAIHVLVNPKDTPKALLIKAIEKID